MAASTAFSDSVSEGGIRPVVLNANSLQMLIVQCQLILEVPNGGALLPVAGEPNQESPVSPRTFASPAQASRICIRAN